MSCCVPGVSLPSDRGRINITAFITVSSYSDLAIALIVAKKPKDKDLKCLYLPPDFFLTPEKKWVDYIAQAINLISCLKVLCSV